MSKKITLLVVMLTIVFGSNHSLWGQIGVLAPQYQPNTQDDQRIDLRRSNSTGVGYIANLTDVGNPENVNNEFGAGESATITAGQLSWPGTAVALNNPNPPNAIQIGSDLSKNIVINTYNAGGYGTGWLRITTTIASANASNFTAATRTVLTHTPEGGTPPVSTMTWPASPVSATTGLAGSAWINVASGDITSSHTALLNGIFNSTSVIDNTLQASYSRQVVDLYVTNHLGTYTHHWRVSAVSTRLPYTSTRAVTAADDNIPLVQTAGNKLTSQDNVTTAPGLGTAPGKDATVALQNYQRPTTIAIEGTNTFQHLIIKDLNWWYRWHEMAKDADGNYFTYVDYTALPDLRGGCGHISGSPGWTTSLISEWADASNNALQGSTYLDAAYQLLAGANVCVTGNVSDETSAPGSIDSPGTDAMLLFPETGNNYSLLIGGNYNDLRMKHFGTNYRLWLSAQSSALTSPDPLTPTANVLFPDDDDSDIFLNEGTQIFTFNGAGALLPNDNNYSPNNGNYYTNITPAPTMTTQSSIFGIYGNYNGYSTIHTATSTAGVVNNRGVIEIGPSTEGQNLFHIYSGGILKNFAGCSNPNTYITVGYNGTSPTFTFNGTDPLYILNDGSSDNITTTPSAIILTAAAASALSSGINGATAAGELHIQAHNYVDIQGPLTMNINSTHNNDVAILSDNEYIKTKDLMYKGGNGLLTLWAKGPKYDLVHGGMIWIEGNVDINSTGTNGSGQTLYRALTHPNISPKYLSCIGFTPLYQQVNTIETLGTPIIHRFQADNDGYTITGTLTENLVGADALLIQGAEQVDIRGATNITIDAAATADVAIQSKNHSVIFRSPFNYTTEGNGTDLFIDGRSDVTFFGGKIETTGTGLNRNIGIQASDIYANVTFNSTTTPFNFDVTNTPFLQVWAGQTIDIVSPLNYIDHPGQPRTYVQFFANQDIQTQASAPVTFTFGNTTPGLSTLTDWIAGRNIVTTNTVTFDYGASAPNTVDNLTLKSLAGNIWFNRPLSIAYGSKQRVLISAEIPCEPEMNPVKNAGYDKGADANRNVENGNIFFNDNLTINRTNEDAGVTDILAKFNIRTAKVSMDDAASTGNNVNIVSHKGDIFLGYSTEEDGQRPPAQSPLSYDLNSFIYTVSDANKEGKLSIRAGYDDAIRTHEFRDGGGNIYFTNMVTTMGSGGKHPMEILIPYSYEYLCNQDSWSAGKLHERLKKGTPEGASMMHYEHSGIIGGVGRCGTDADYAQYDPSFGPGNGGPAKKLSLQHKANDGYLLLDAGLNGNIIMNTGSELDFQGKKGEGFFRTRKGDIDMRGETNIMNLPAYQGLVFLADNGNPDKSIIACDCAEEFNNVYMQDFDFATFSSDTDNNGSVYFGADNNIKLQYGGLRNIGTWKDPFLSMNRGYGGGGDLCNGDYFHCDSDPDMNKARQMTLNYTGKATGGVGVVASDLIDVYKPIKYTGDNTTGMRPVPSAPTTGIPAPNNDNKPNDGKLHGENVAGYGLYIKTQANKKNWTVNPFEVINECDKDCFEDVCGTNAALHRIARVTFHDDARILAENSKVYIGSPVLDVYGHLELNTFSKGGGSNQLLHIQTDSLIAHDSVIIDGSRLQLTTWSRLERDMPVIKLGHQRKTPPATDFCVDCFRHVKGGKKDNRTVLDTINVKFMNGFTLKRLHTLVADHTVLTFLSDSYDGLMPDLPPVLNAKVFVDTMKIRNQVELWTSADKKHDGHFELVSEIQMTTKNQAGIFTRHLHMEPIAPNCSSSKYSELWLPSQTLDVISTSTFGGYGTVHADVYVETIGRLAPGYASLGVQGNCYEDKAGTLYMQDLRMDKGAELHYSIGSVRGLNNEYTDCIDVDHLLMRGDINIFVEKRCDQFYTPGCYPIIRYKSVDAEALNNLKLATTRIDGHLLALDKSEFGVINLCVGEVPPPLVQREVILPTPPAGITISPKPGVHYVPWGYNFTFTLNFLGRSELLVTTSRVDNSPLGRSGFEVLTGKLNANGEYEYTLVNIKTEPIYIYIGPETVGIESLDKAAVWSSGNTLYIKVKREDIASIYSVTGTLVSRIEVPEGGTTLPLSRGAYIVTLKDGSVHKVIISK